MNNYNENTDDLLKYKKIKIPKKSRLFIFSDVHGKKNEVDLLIKKVGGKDTDHYAFIGDIIDRGPHSSALLFDMMLKNNYHMCIGNHEHFLIKSCYDDIFFQNWMFKNDKYDNGGIETFYSIFRPGMNFFKEKLTNKCPLILEIEHGSLKLGLVHAEIPLFFDTRPYISKWNDIVEYSQSNSYYGWDMIWGRKVINNIIQHAKNGTTSSLPEIEGIDFVLHGHTGVRHPIRHQNMIWFDTGFSSGKISMLEYSFEDKDFIVHQLNDDEISYIKEQGENIIV